MNPRKRKMEASNEYRWGIAFFDVETTVKDRAIYEFAAILLCPQRLTVIDSYSTLVRPARPHLNSIPPVMSNGITRDEIDSAPIFPEIAHKVYDFLHGRIWAGHNIRRWDCVRIREAFAEIGRPAPEPLRTIDSLDLLTRRFGQQRAGNMKLSLCRWPLGNYFDLGQQSHRSLDDVRMNIEVLKNCSMVLFLEPSLPGELITNSWVSPNDTTRPVPVSVEMSSNAAVHEGNSGYAGFLQPNEVSIPFISASLVPSYRGRQKIQLLHENRPLQLYCTRLSVIFGPNSKFFDRDGRPRLNIVVDPSPSLCKVLDVCDNLANWLSVDSRSSSEWRPVVTTENPYTDSSTIQLHIPLTNGDFPVYDTKIYRKDASGNDRMLSFSRVDAAELNSLFVSGTLVDAYFSLYVYDYDQQNAGIQLMAKKLIIHAN